MLELAASRATDPTARDHPGREPRVRPHPVVIGSELIYYEQARTRTYCLHLYPLPTYYFRLTTCDMLTTPLSPKVRQFCQERTSLLDDPPILCMLLIDQEQVSRISKFQLLKLKGSSFRMHLLLPILPSLPSLPCPASLHTVFAPPPPPYPAA